MPLQESDLIFPYQEQPSFSQVLSRLKQRNLSIHNRLNSILEDARFVSRVARVYHTRPLVANERCGSWYVKPQDKRGSAYFKSTDGHERAWKFSTRRLNLHLIELIERNDGIIIVDSTRRGKKMPDALSVTVPVWCAVLNRALLPDHPLSSKLFLPPHILSSVHAQVDALLPAFVESLQALRLPLPPCLTKPLRPLWITQDSNLAWQEADEDQDTDRELGESVITSDHESNNSGTNLSQRRMRDLQNPIQVFEDYRPVICCTSSRRVVDGIEADGRGYIQGAGDDTENWAHGLTPPVFWNNVDQLLATSEAELPQYIEALLLQHSEEISSSMLDSENNRLKQLTSYISVSPLPLPPHVGRQDSTSQGPYIQILCLEESTPKESWIKSSTRMEVGLGKSKTASRNLRLALPDICAFVSKVTDTDSQFPNALPSITIACASGKELSVGVALALSCYFFDDEEQFRVERGDVAFTKTRIKAKLGRIMTKFPEANPNRATLQSVNSFLMDWRK